MPKLPPTIEAVRSKVNMNRHERKGYTELNMNHSAVLNDRIQAVYMEFRDLGYRNELWDGNG